jgi:hypothetical protein
VLLSHIKDSSLGTDVLHSISFSAEALITGLMPVLKENQSEEMAAETEEVEAASASM